MGKIRRATAGTPFGIRAVDYNKIADTVEAVDRAPLDLLFGGMRKTACPQTTILARNDSGEDVDRLGCLAFNAALYSPIDFEQNFKNGPAVTGTVPAATNHGIALIAMEPINDGRIGRCVMRGVTPAWVRVTDIRYQYADLENGEATLVTQPFGPARILYIAPTAPEDGPDVRLALIEIGPGQIEYEFDAIVTGSTSAIADEKWTYDFEYQLYDAAGAPVTDIADPLTGVAVNRAERYNDAGTSIFPGILDADTDATLTILPVAVDCPIRVRRSMPAGWVPGDPFLYSFSEANPILVDCG